MKTKLIALGCVTLLLAAAGLTGCRKPDPIPGTDELRAMDSQIDWSRAGLIAVQDGNRYKTLDSFSREALAIMTGREHFPGVSPVGSMLEWNFNRNAYRDIPLVRVSSESVVYGLLDVVPAERRTDILKDKRFTLRQVSADAFTQALTRIESDTRKRSAASRARHAQVIAMHMDAFLQIVPQPGGSEKEPWHTPETVLGSLTDAHLGELGLSRAALPVESRFPIDGLSPTQALEITTAWASLRSAWMQRDATRVQQYLERLATQLPALASAQVYPALSQRQAEARYYAQGKFTYAWILYFVGVLFSVVALVTQWRWAWIVTLLFTLLGLGIHTYGMSLRWYILARIPVANIFEAVMAASVIAIVVGLLVEGFHRTRVLLVAAAAVGFMACISGQYILPNSELNTIPAILDDIQLRIHTVMIITAYALSYIGAVVALVYLGGFYGWKLQNFAALAPAPAATLDQGGALALGSGPSTLRPIMAGGAPGDDTRHSSIPTWLNNIDMAHLIILNMIFVLLFVGGIILGAWWADYSWGRPWGWDPKEVFALNTWIIYAILIHLRFAVQKNKGLWTAWLSIAGCAMVTFNWFYVNFFIVSIHSYA